MVEKKRVRPTWTMVRQLEADLSETKNRLSDEVSVLRKSERSLLDVVEAKEHEIKELRERVVELESRSADDGRSFWSRLFRCR